ncbi:MAG: protease pro-enzyme activation domain-containing protein, partial [Silvibacterium sp.]
MLAKILRSLSPIAFAAAALTLIAPALLVAQATSSLVTTRLTQPIDENSRVTLKGTLHPLASAANDRGAAPDSMPLDRVQVVLKRSDAQESALKQLITDLHTPGSASYHKWLTPDQFGKQFGPSDQDIATLESWLQSKGFSITRLNPGKQTLEISGNVAQFRDAFHTQIHKYLVEGQTHYANAADPQIPSALAPVFGGFTSLNNFRGKNYAKVLGKATYDPRTDKATPLWTTGPGTPAIDNNYVLAPGDFAVQYDLNPLYAAGVNGSGQTIAIVNDSNINIYLANQYRTLFGLSANPPQVIIDGNDPGIDGINDPDGPNGDSVEAYLDVEQAGAVAPNATIDLVIAADTELEYGLLLAAEHAVYGNIAPVISMSFGLCETYSPSLNAAFATLWEQAAAQGITVMVSSGDSASAGCDDSSQYYAIGGQAVTGWGESAYNVSVGGTDFFYSSYNGTTAAINAQLGTFWTTAASNSSYKPSLQAVIPEQPWNNSQFGLNIFNILTESSGTVTAIAGGGGGASTCATLSSTNACVPYPKPAWQKGAGVPADSARDVPDLALYAAIAQNGSFYPECYQDGDCQPVSGGNTVQITAVGGTSASSPAFAGIMALVNQKYGRQGQADFVLYPLATQFPAAFHDVTVGSNSVPCSFSPTSPNCISITNPPTITDPTYGPAIEGQIGNTTTKAPEYNATTGYDLASGLGSVDANVLFTNWGNVKFATSNTTLTPSETTFTHGTPITISGTVTPSTATGDVALMTDSTEPVQQGQPWFTLKNGSYSSNSVNFLPGGTYNIWGQY